MTSRPRGRIPTEQLAHHEEAFLDAASELFFQKGFARVSIDMLARAARVSPKTIYARYGGKVGLFGAVIRRRVAPVLATQDLFADQKNAAPEVVLRNVAAAFLDRILHPDVLSLHRMMIAEATHMPELSELYYNEAYTPALNRMADWLAVQNTTGRLTISDSKRASEVLASLVGAGILERALLLNIVPDAAERAQLLDNALTIFFSAYGPTDRQSKSGPAKRRGS